MQRAGLTPTRLLFLIFRYSSRDRTSNKLSSISGVTAATGLSRTLALILAMSAASGIPEVRSVRAAVAAEVYRGLPLARTMALRSHSCPGSPSYDACQSIEIVTSGSSTGTRLSTRPSSRAKIRASRACIVVTTGAPATRNGTATKRDVVSATLRDRAIFSRASSTTPRSPLRRLVKTCGSRT